MLRAISCALCPVQVVDTPTFVLGDVVRVLNDMVMIHSLQAGHEGWNDDMALVSKQVL